MNSSCYSKLASSGIMQSVPDLEKQNLQLLSKMKSPRYSVKQVFKILRSKSSVTLPPYMASPIRYLRVSQGNSASSFSNALVKYMLMSLKEILKSDSLKSQLTFHPILPNFFLSQITAWKNDSTQSIGLNSALGHDSKISSDSLEYVFLMF